MINILDIIDELSDIQDLDEVISMVNPHRSVDNLDRRLMKMLEEVGEVSEAWLGATALHNHKNKNWDDVREEVVDSFIVVTDCLATSFPDHEHKLDIEEANWCPAIDNIQNFLRLSLIFLSTANNHLHDLNDIHCDDFDYDDYLDNLIKLQGISRQAMFLRLPHDNEKSDLDIESEILCLIRRKLKKWIQASGGVITAKNNDV